MKAPPTTEGASGNERVLSNKYIQPSSELIHSFEETHPENTPSGPIPVPLDAMEFLGHALLSALNGAKDPVEIERDDGYIEVQPISLFLDTVISPVEETLLNECRGRLLDAGCGSGRLALPLLACGQEVTCLDISPTLIEVARRRGIPNTKIGSIWDDLGGPWDTILLGGNTIGLAVTYENTARLFGHLRKHLASHGAVLLTSADITRRREALHTSYEARNLTLGRPRGMMQIRFRYREEQSAWFDWLHLPAEDLSRIAQQQGFSFTLLDEDPHGLYAARLVLSEGS